jgi:pyruvate formate lyase activating enzyme
MSPELSPPQIVAAALRANCQSIAYTYTEPTIFFEYAYDTARLGHEAGLANVVVTNGFMSGDALDALEGYLDAVNVDLKAFRDDTYRDYTGGRLKPVLCSLAAIARLGIWLEVTTPLVPGVNDDAGELKELAAFVAIELGVDTPWHISRFFPAYKMANIPPTPLATLHRARDIGYEAGLRYVYVGNTAEEQNTFCHHCGHLLVRRDGYGTVEQSIQTDGYCPSCGTRAAGLWTHESLER